MATIILFGVAHFSAGGNIEADVWEWGLLIDGEEIPIENRLQMRTDEAKTFVQEMTPYLSEDYKEKMTPPSSIPGGNWNLFLKSEDFGKNIFHMNKLFVKYFPKDTEILKSLM